MKSENDNQLILDWKPKHFYHQYPVTRIVKKFALSLDQNLFPNIQFQPPNGRIVNPYPKWVNERRLWAPIGTLTDYMIRKILSLEFPKRVIPEVELAAAPGLRHLNDIERWGEKLNPFFDHRNEWIREYYESKTLLKAISPASQLVCLEEVYRSRALNPVIELNEVEIRNLLPFYEKIHNFLRKKFSQVGQFILNPDLTNEYLFKGDADLIADRVLFEIKTVKNPLKYIQSHQLLLYTAMHSWLQYYRDKMEGISSDRYNCLDSSSIGYLGFIWPLHLDISIAKINNWNGGERLQSLHSLISRINSETRNKS